MLTASSWNTQIGRFLLAQGAIFVVQMQPTALPMTITASAAQGEAVAERFSEVEEARRVRICWMTEMGLDNDQIVEDLEREPPTSLNEELEQLAALRKYNRAIAPAADLAAAATTY